MLFRLTFAILLLPLSHSLVEGQNRLRFGPELGVSVSQLPARTILHDRGSASSYKDVLLEPLVAGPLIGGRAQLEAGKRWLFAAALRYQILGEEHTRKTEFRSAWEMRVKDKQVFHQVGVPLSVGYRLFRIAEVPVTFSAGAQLNWLLRAQYQTGYTSKNDVREYSYKEEPINLLEQTNALRVPVRPFQVQLHTALSAPIGDKLRFSIQYNAGSVLSAYDDLSGIYIPPHICIEPFGTWFRHNEFSVVAAYFLGGR